MIKNFFITGDTHGGFSTITRVSNIARNNPELKPEETGIIILGDCGLNFYLNKTDKKHKKILNAQGYTIYCVRGNHEERPENIATYHMVFDENVKNFVWIEDEFPNIKFFVDGLAYNINGHYALVIGGAYSIDKYWRLQRAGYSSTDVAIADPKKTGWFKDECLTREEMNRIGYSVANHEYDFVFSHTAPICWEPTDLFLGCVDQSTVDKSMEIFLNDIKENIGWGIWCFGHYHADRIERPHVEQFYMEYEDIETVWERWQKYNETQTLDWWLPKSPNFYMEVNNG